MAYQIILPKPVIKQLDRLPPGVRRNLVEKIASLREIPRPRGSVKLRAYENEYRIRVGDYRIRYEVDDKQSLVVILHCMHRTDVYRK